MSKEPLNQVHNEQTKLLATGLNNVAVACVVIGVVTPISAMSFGVASAPPLSFRAGAFALVWLMAGSCLTLVCQTRIAEPQAMSSGEIFVTFVLPATLVVMGWLAVYANEWAIKRDEAREKRAPGE